VGSIGNAAAFSFYPSKNLGAYGEGGGLTTNDAAVAAHARTLRSHGEPRRYAHDEIGYNYRMDGFQGAILRIKLRRLAAWNARRAELAAIYRRILGGARVEMQEGDASTDRVYHVFVVYADDRDAVRAKLEERGIQTAIHYPLPIHLQKGYQALGYKRGDFPHAERACERVFGMPIFPELTDEQVTYAAESLREIVGDKSK
jgi:dTDP-4-amino-4,6-dideoxygalactose transaminase